jgi:hypothetical protein
LSERIARLCSQFTLDDLTAAAARFGAADPLDRIVAAVRDGARMADLESDLDELDDAFARNGVDDITTGTRIYHAMPGSSGHPVMRVWVCPAPRPCARMETADGARCGLLSRPLAARDVKS